MKKSYVLALSLLLVIFVSGCRPASGPDYQPGTSGGSSVKELQPGAYTMKVGDSISVDGRVVKLLDVNSASGNVVVNVDGQVLEFPTTRLPKVASSLEVQTIRVDYGRTPADNTATLDVRKFELGPNEYFMSSEQEVVVAGTTVRFEDLTKADGARLSVNLENFILEPGETRNVLNLQITHKKSYDNPVRLNRKVVLEIKQAV